MPFTKTNLVAITLAGFAAATPIVRDAGSVNVISKTVQNQNVDELQSVGTIDPDVKSFLDKYQSNSLASSFKANTANLTAYPASGLCSKEYPCFSVDKVATVSFGSDAGFDTTKAGALLDQILAQPNLTFGAVSSWNPAPGLKIATDDLTFEAIGIEETIESKLMAGAVLDLFKAQGLGQDSNAIRGVSASETPETLPVIGLCVYPNGADMSSVSTFCHGQDGGSSLQQRGFLDGAKNFICGLPLMSMFC